MSVREVKGIGHVVVGSRGRQRLVLIVCCPFCGRKHQHTAARGFVVGRRGAGCRRGRYEVLLRVGKDGPQ